MHEANPKCHHGVPLADADECVYCLHLEAVKIDILREAERTLCSYTDDRTTRAIMLTAFGRFVSMKLHNPQHGPQILQTLREVMRQSLPAPPERLMIAQQVMLVDLSFEAHLPE